MFPRRPNFQNKISVNIWTLGLVLACVAFLGNFAGCGADLGQNQTAQPGPPTLGETVFPAGGADDIVSPSGAGDLLPSLSLRATPSFCCDPLAIDFAVDLSDPSLASKVVIEWDFGDGRSARGAATKHTFPWPNDYLVTATVRLDNGMVLKVERVLQLRIGDDGRTEIDLAPTVPSTPQNTDSQGDLQPALGPVADAGPDRFATAGDKVTLDGTGSFSRDANVLRFGWTQQSGPSVALVGATSAVARFIAPQHSGDSALLTFELRVMQGELSASDVVAVTIRSEGDLIPLPPNNLNPGDPGDPPGPDPNADADGDGLPDGWEIKYFGNTAIYAGGDDPDGDGAANALEYRYGTNPRVPDINQLLLNQLEVAVRVFWASGGRFEHARDGTLVGWPMVKTVDGASPILWGVDDDYYANEPVISVMGPGVPDIGLVFLRAYEATGNKLFLEYAVGAAKTLLSVQRDLETYPDGSLRPPLSRGGWMDYAVVVRDNEDTRSQLPAEIGHWTILRLPGGTGDVRFVSRLESYMTFDDSISTSPAMFLLEMYAALRNRDFSGDIADPLRDLRPELFLEGATKFLRLADGYRTDFELHRSDFENVYIQHAGGDAQKNGPHPFLAYLARLPGHPLNNGAAFKPYASGGLPQGAVDLEWLVRSEGEKYGALATGYFLHKCINDHVMSTYTLFLLRYYEVTGDTAALNSLQTQLTWLGNVFRAQGSRGWCQQYHVLDETCAAARPWEPPAIAMREGIRQISSMVLIEKILEDRFGIVRNDVRQTLEDAAFYVHRVAPRDEVDMFFQYYALTNLGPATNPNAYPALRVNDPMFSCDYYYPQDPFRPCGAPYDGLGYQLYRIDEQSNGEFTAPNAEMWLADIGDDELYNYFIADQCLQDPARLNYRNCLDLNKPVAQRWNYWDLDRQYWDVWPMLDVQDHLHNHLPNDSGLWTSTETIRGVQRTVINTQDLRKTVLELALYVKENRAGIADSDSDGLSDADEQLRGTDPFYPDSDGDGTRDGDEVAAGTDPTKATSYP